MTSMNLRNAQRQQPGLSPRLQHAVRLLQLPSMEFAQEVQAVLDTNPFLDTLDDEAPEEAVETAAAAEPAATGSPDPEPLNTGADDDERDSWQTLSTAEAPQGGELEDSLMNRVAAETSLSAHLLEQLHLLPLSARDLLMAGAVVQSLDDDGYLRLEDLDELIAVTALSPAASPEELQIALRRVQSLDPAGVGARSVVECLTLQLTAIDCPERELAQVIVTQHLEVLAHKDVTSLARTLRRPPDEVAAACLCIRRLDPRPGWRFGAADIRYLTPDVIVKKQRGSWAVSLNPVIVPKVRLHKVYAEMFQRQQQVAHPELAEQLREARWTLRNVEQRFATILGVAQAIVRRQHNFFDHGPLAMKPMGLREIADEIGVHESTVSRVTNNKYMATPFGVFELKYFFSRAMTAVGGSAFSGTAIRELVKDMLEHEQPGAPLSDVEIARQLAMQGFTVARRTVTKYRHLLRVEAVERRRVGEV